MRLRRASVSTIPTIRSPSPFTSMGMIWSQFLTGTTCMSSLRARAKPSQQLALEAGGVARTEGEDLGHLVGRDEDAQAAREPGRRQVGGSQGHREDGHEGGGNEGWAAHGVGLPY